MPQISRYQRMKLSKLKIKKYFESNTDKIFNIKVLGVIFKENLEGWNLAKVTKLEDFIEFLTNAKILKEMIEIKLPNNKNTKRYITGDYSIYDLAFAIHPKGYFSHYTAMSFHNLTINIPKVHYINFEQTNKFISGNSTLSQEGINRAFSNNMRKTNQIAEFKDEKVYMLNGKNTGNLGIESINIGEKEYLITGIERTLIDIVVRPEYAGGVIEIIEAYKLAKGRCSINILINILKEINYIYPYHQAIGFYLEKAGYKENILQKIEKIPMEFDFYLGYKIKDREYSERWKLFFPKGI